GAHAPGLGGGGAFDDEDQLSADGPVKRKLRAGCEARHLRGALRGGVLPQNLEADSRLKLLPSDVVDRDDLGSWAGRHRPSFRSWVRVRASISVCRAQSLAGDAERVKVALHSPPA